MNISYRYLTGLMLGAGILGANVAWAHPRDSNGHGGKITRENVTRRCQADPRVRLGQVSLEVCVGGELFFNETFQGNGRTCSSCHPASNNYTLDSDYISRLPDDDPLFIAESDTNLAALEVPQLLREAALIVVNPDGFDKPFLVRSVSHMLGIAITKQAPPLDLNGVHATDGTRIPPLERLGWSGDGAPGNGELRDFADGAIAQHLTRSLERRPGVDFVLPTDAEKDAIAAFSGTIGRMEEIDINAVRLNDVGAEAGRNTFLTGSGRECARRCHINAGATAFTLNANGEVQAPSNVSLDIGTALVRDPLVDALGIPLDAGFGKGPLDLDGDGKLDSFGNGGMNVPPLIEAADTPPMFHTNAFATLEEAIGFYASEDFAKSFIATVSKFENRDFGQPIPLSEQDIKEVGRFLRVLNASLNCQMASYRLSAAIEVTDTFGERERKLVSGLVEMTNAELRDALQVLNAVGDLHTHGQRTLLETLFLLKRSANESNWLRRRHLRDALDSIGRVEQSFGSGLTMKLGQGTLMF